MFRERKAGVTSRSIATAAGLLLAFTGSNAAHADTMMGVESNAMQFYPRASDPEAKVHPGLYQRREGKLELGSVQGSGFGYRLQEIDRKLDAPVKQFGVTSL